MIEEHLPWKEVERNVNDKPWVTDHYWGLYIKKHNAYLTGDTRTYLTLRNKINHMSKFLKRNYCQGVAEDTNTHSIWQIIDSLTGTKKNTNNALQSLANLKCQGDMHMLGESINKSFQSISNDLPVIPHPQSLELAQVPDKYIISVADIEKCLSHIKICKASGPDGIPNWVLCDFASLLAGPLASVVNSSIRETFIPDVWKCADVLPLLKVNPPTVIEKDLRPISLTPIVSKACVEHFICEWLWECIEDHIDPQQYGGKKGSSTVYALIQLLHEWYTATDTLKTIVDFAKAFDHINHNIIVNKLISMNVPPIITNWIAAFLHNRKQ